jgi:hypothetical protein
MASAALLRDVDGPTLRRQQVPLINISGPTLWYRQHLLEMSMGQSYGGGSISQKHQWANPMASAAPLGNINWPTLGCLPKILMGPCEGLRTSATCWPMLVFPIHSANSCVGSAVYYDKICVMGSSRSKMNQGFNCPILGHHLLPDNLLEESDKNCNRFIFLP